jgi:hypothetical protein
MKSLVKFCLIVLFVPSMVSLAHADEPAASKWAKDCVKHRLLEPLAQQESKRSPFSRAAPPPDERRVNVLTAQFSRDQKGREFISFEVDARYGDDWHTTYNGCVVRGSGDVLIQIGEEHRPAAYLLGKDVAPIEGACQAKAAEPGA